MNGFRLFSVGFNDKTISTETIELINKENINSSDNYYTLLIGNNGTGKSRILSKVTRYFNERLRIRRQKLLFDENELIFNRLPEKVIAVTNSISDKFPIDRSFRTYRPDNKESFLHSDLNYNYLGTRNKFNSFSSGALINKTLEIVLENYYELDISRNYRYIFDYLDYEPIIKLRYRLSIRSRHFDLSSIKGLKEHIVSQNEKYNPNYYISDNEIKELHKFLINRSPNNDFEILINFSEKNIHRISKDSSIYDEKFYNFKMISILKKIRLITNNEIIVYKKGGDPFSFKDASSGEANILSTLLSLIPLLKNNSLVLIDEPEISLHPLWQSKYIDLLKKIFKSVKGCHIIIATHSPFLASSLEPDKSAVISLTNNKGIIKSELIKSSTFGWGVNDILLDVFNMPTTRNLNLYNVVSEALNILADEKHLKNDLVKTQQILKEYYPYIKENDPIKSVINTILNIKE